MTVYSIKDLEKLSGIKAHTIRIWEQRYNIIQPRRTTTNIRYYLDGDLKRLLNIALLNKNGIKISKIARMEIEEIEQKVAELTSFYPGNNSQLDALTLSMIEVDEYKFDKIISTNIKQIGFEKTMMEIIQPFLEKISLLWMTNSLNAAQELFISNLIRQKIIGEINKIEVEYTPEVLKFLLFLPKGETHELSLLFVNFLLKSRGYRVIYLGADVHIEDVCVITKIHQPDFVFTMVNHSAPHESLLPFVNAICQTFNEAKILFSGYQIASHPHPLPQNAQKIDSIEGMISFLNNLSA